MSTVLQICNKALIQLGANPITSLNLSTKESQLCNLLYEETRDSLLNSHPWNFAIKRATPTLLSSTPEYEYSHEFQIPTDCLRVLQVGTSSYQLKFAVENGVLRCSSDSITIKYIAKITQPNTFSRAFNEALVWQLAYDMSYSMLQDTKRVQQISDKLESVLSFARHQDSQEGTPEAFIPDEWIGSRGNEDLWSL